MIFLLFFNNFFSKNRISTQLRDNVTFSELAKKNSKIQSNFLSKKYFSYVLICIVASKFYHSF